MKQEFAMMDFSGNTYIQPGNSEMLVNSQVSGVLGGIYGWGEGLMGTGRYLDSNIGLAGIPSVSAPAGFSPLCCESLVPQPQYHIPQYPSTAFIVPFSDLPYFPMQSFIHLPQPRVPTIEQAHAFAEQYTQSPYAVAKVFPHAYPAPPIQATQKPSESSAAERGECVEMRGESSDKDEGLLHPSTSITPSQASQSQSAAELEIKNIPISDTSEKIIKKDKAHPNLIVTIKCPEGFVAGNDRHATKPSPTSNSETLEKVERKRPLSRRRKRKLGRSQASKLAYKNAHVEPFKFRNVYKFIVKNVHGHVEAKVVELREKMAAEGFSEEAVSAGLERIKRLRNKESPMDSQRQSRWKIERLILSSPGCTFILKEALVLMLEGLEGDEYNQIMEKNKGTYIEACEKYLREATLVLNARPKISHFDS